MWGNKASYTYKEHNYTKMIFLSTSAGYLALDISCYSEVHFIFTNN